MKTEYRLKLYGSYYFLQFKSYEMRRIWYKPWKRRLKQVWRFVPKDKSIYQDGFVLYPTDCPRYVPTTSMSHFLWSYTGSDYSWSLDNIFRVTNTYLDIDQYFSEHRSTFLHNKTSKNTNETPSIVYLNKD